MGFQDGKPVVGEPEFQSFVGPTLGQDSIRRGVWACYVALGLVVLFMLWYYRMGGFVANLALALNLLFLLAIMAFFRAELSLPGIAGIVLTVGMAVDANILIFERIREEQARGRTVIQAFEAGHERAFGAILDGNLTTLLSALVLYIFGSGPVEGFAVTLSIGILTTMFSVLFCAKVILRTLIAGGTLREFRMMRFMANPNYNFNRYLVPCSVISAVLVVGGFFDVKLGPGIDGIETIRQAKDIDPNIMCCIVSAYQDRQIEEIMKIFGDEFSDHWDFLTKPFSSAEITQKANNLISNWNRKEREKEYYFLLLALELFH
jgi:protein-export SecD/SecF family membrane protein